jgi:hypothetical protein
VLFLSTVFEGPETVIRVRRRPNSSQPYSRSIKKKFGSKSVLQLALPSVAAYYNDRMNAVDIGDQLRSNMHDNHRQRGGPARVLTWSFLLATALANSFLLQRKGQPVWTPFKSQSRWQQALVDEIFLMYGPEGCSRQRNRIGNPTIPIDQHLRGQRGQSRCLACQGVQIGPRKTSRRPRNPRNRAALQTLDANSINSRDGRAAQSRARARAQGPRIGTKVRWGCLTCNVALCKEGKCWDFYHKPIS